MSNTDGVELELYTGRGRVQTPSGAVFTAQGDPVQPQPKLQPSKRELPWYMLLPCLTDSTKINVYALEEGVLVYKGRIWQAEGYHHCETGKYHTDKGWMAEPKGWSGSTEPDHYGTQCSTDPDKQKEAAISRCITGARSDK